MTRNDVALAALAAIISKTPYSDPHDGTTRDERIGLRVDAAFAYADAFADEQKRRRGGDGINIVIKVDTEAERQRVEEMIDRLDKSQCPGRKTTVGPCKPILDWGVMITVCAFCGGKLRLA